METERDPGKYKSFFLIGIGGAGMSAIATVLKGMGISVRGSDLKSSRYTELLTAQGIEVIIGHNASNLKGSDAVIYSAAISSENEEMVRASRLGIPLFTRGELLAWIMNSKKGIAITGTHGKTTTTSMVSMVFRGLELDPTIIVGGELNELGTNARYGSGQYIIAEACESDGTFLKYRPFAGVITNIEEDHMDYWKDFSTLKESFTQFIGNIKEGGFAVINGDEIDPDFIRQAGSKKIITFGTDPSNHLIAKDINLSGFMPKYRLLINECDKSKQVKEYQVRLSVPGMHNVKNSLAALAVCYGLGLDMEKSAGILQYFTGAKRRFEKRGEKNGATIFDDYAHHPSEIKATLDTAAIEKKKNIITVFQPHRYSRLANLYNRFGDSFKNTDILIITDVFGSNEKPIPGITGRLLVDSLIEDGYSRRLAYIPSLRDVPDYLDTLIQKDDMVIIMGAGDVTRVTDELLKKQPLQ